MKKLPQRDPFSVRQREAIAQRCVGFGASCTRCGEARPRALIRGSDPMICYNCGRVERGMTVFDLHHPSGEANSQVKIPIWTNDHVAELSVLQKDWPTKTLENPDLSPLRAAAGRTRGCQETTVYLVNTMLQPNAELLEALDEYLEEKFGRQWWIGTPLEKFAPKTRRKKGV